MQDPLSEDQQQILALLAEGAHAAGNASVAANPSDPAFFMLLDGHVTVPVVHRDGCYICEDPEFAAMGLPLCSPCPDCVRERMEVCPVCSGRGATPDNAACHDCLAVGFTGGMGHIPADDDLCDECNYQHGPWDYDQDGLLTGMPREKALFVQSLRTRN